MIGLCLAPVLLMGYAMTFQPADRRHPSNVDGVVIEAMTCEKRLGFDVKASTAGLFGFGLQYGLPIFEETPVTLTFLPKAGLSYTTAQRRELPQTAQFEVGGQLLLGYGSYRVGLEYWHLSNAGMTQPNLGLDMIVVQTGFAF